MATGKGRTFEESLKMVQERRKMADPNPAFCEQLRGFACSPALKQLQEKLLTSLTLKFQLSCLYEIS